MATTPFNSSFATIETLIATIESTYRDALCFVLVGEAVRKHCVANVAGLERLMTLENVRIIEIPESETHKNLDVFIKIIEALSENNADRNSLLINVGGGMICDIGGFSASCYKRGIDYINVPTSLLAMVDASHGGKTGIDFGHFKNQIGLFSHPKMVVIETDFLKTLPKDQTLSGFAEMLKMALITSEDSWTAIKQADLNNIETLKPLIIEAIQQKLSVVEKDPTEKNERKILNFGHTFGHAFETFAMQNGKELLHGNAVAMGMLCELWLSEKMLNFDSEKRQDISQFILSTYPKFHIETADFESVFNILLQDKKNTNTEIKPVLLEKIGAPNYNLNCSKDLCFEALQAYSAFCTKIDLPASKSLSNRWLVLRACTASETVLHNLSDATDTVLMQDLLDKISHAKPSENPVEIDCKNAGTVLRFLTAYLSATPGKWLVTGDERLSVRPIADLVDALNSLGAEISYVNKHEQLPLLIAGKPGFSQSRVTLTMEKSSQFASALMLIVSKFPNGLTIDFDGEIISKPYLEMTAKILEQCGVQVNCTEKNITLKGNPKCPAEIFIEADWTSASYFYALVALSENGVLEIDNLHENSLQGDSILAKWFEKFGVETIFSPTKITIKKVSKPSITELDLDFSDYPDLAQTMAVLCVALNIPARLTGLSTLRDKETDRLQALSNELNKINAKHSIEKNTLILYTNDTLNFSQPIETYGDHRMAMAFAIFSEQYDCVEITSPEIVNKSFPNFWEQHDKLKFTH